MNILIVSDYFQPKIGYAKPQVAKALQTAGHTVEVLTSERYFPFHNYENSVQKTIGKRIRSVGTKMENGIKVTRKKTIFEYFTRTYFEDLESELVKRKPDLVIVFGMSSPSMVRVARLKYKHKFKLTAVDSHLPSELSQGNAFFKQIFYGVFRLLFSKTISQSLDVCVALQDDTTQVIRETFGIKKNVTVVPNGTNIEQFQYTKTGAAKVKKDFHIPRNKTIIMYSGKIIKEKGVHLLAAAFAKIISKNKNVHLLLVGDGPKEYIDQVKNTLEKHSGTLTITGFQPHESMQNFYSAADIAVWPLQESLAMVDAAACSIPFIANDTLGDKTRISNNNALLYKKENLNDLVEKITRLVTDPELRKQMGKRGRTLVENTLSWNALCLRFLP